MVSTSSKKRKVVGFSLYAPDPVKEDEELAMLGLANEMKDGSPHVAAHMDTTFPYRRTMILEKRSIQNVVELFPLLLEKDQVSNSSSCACEWATPVLYSLASQLAYASRCRCFS